MTTRAAVIEAITLIQRPRPVEWSSAWWEEGTIQERSDVTFHWDPCRPREHRFIARGRSNVARCAICGERTHFKRLDEPPQCSEMVKERGLPVLRRCKGLAWAPGAKHCWKHFRNAQ